MNALTKVFVVLLVICSLVLTASVVTFVQRVDNYKKVSDDTKRQLDEARRNHDAAINAANAERATYEANNTQLTAQLTAKNTEISRLQNDVVRQATEIAQRQTREQSQALSITHLTEGLKSAQDTASKQSAMISDLRSNVDTLLTRAGELSSAVNDLTNRLDVTTRDMRFYQEQLTEAQARLARTLDQARSQGVNLDAGGTRSASVGAPPINGVVRDVRNIGGVTYATISVGSSDSVEKGMRFSVIDRERGTFLGFLNVDSVEPNEATGRLEGPRVTEVRAGHEVRTQL